MWMQNRGPSPLSDPGLLQSQIPEGFDAFWQGLVEKAEAAPLDFQLTPSGGQCPDGRPVQLLDFRGVNGEELHGWAVLSDTGEFEPGFLWVPPYSRWSMLPNQYGTRLGMASLSFNFFGESSFHQEAYKPERGYFAEGIESPETWIFARMFQNACLGMRILAELPGVDKDRLSACGMSQGGGMSVWLGAFCPLVSRVCADLPFLAGVPRLIAEGRIHRYPLKELVDWIGEDSLRKEQVLETLSWFDTAHLATRCRVPTQLTLGHKDPSVRPWQVQLIHEALAGEKKLDELDWGHDWHPSMVDRNRDWMS